MTIKTLLPRRAVDVAGQRFGMLVAVRPTGDRTRRGELVWECRCDCGGAKLATATKLRRGTPVSCGCGPKGGSPPTHGHARTTTVGVSPTYSSWLAMCVRCRDTKHPAFAHYGGRGISVCERWRSFENFLLDMGERPAGMTLDRYPDRDGNYEPSNCRWATAKQQNRNTRASRLIAVRGETATVAEWSERTGVRHSTILERLKRGWSAEAAVGPVPPQGEAIRRGWVKRRQRVLEGALP